MRWIWSGGRCQQHHVQNHVASQGARERQRAYRLSTSPLVEQSGPSWCRRQRKDLTWCCRTRKRSDRDPAPKIFVTPGQKAEASRGCRPITHSHTMSSHSHTYTNHHTRHITTCSRKKNSSSQQLHMMLPCISPRRPARNMSAWLVPFLVLFLTSTTCQHCNDPAVEVPTC